METKQIESFDFKAVTPEGTFEGLLSPFGTVDQQGDIVEPTAFSKNLAERGNQRPLLWQHQSDKAIGMLTLDERPQGLWAKGQLLMTIADGQDAYKRIKAGIVSGLSIGFRTIRDDWQSGRRHLKELALYEGSIVTFGAHPDALITQVKSLDHQRIESALQEFKRDILAALERKS